MSSTQAVGPAASLKPLRIQKAEHGLTEYTITKPEFALAAGLSINARLHLAVYGEDSPDSWQEKEVVVFHPPLGLTNKIAKEADKRGFDKGWGKHLIGPGRFLDTKKHLVVIPETLGGRAIEGKGSSTSATELIGRYGADIQLALQDTSNLTAQVLRENFGIRRISAAAGISLGSHIAYKWLQRRDVGVDKIIDICGGENLCPATREYLGIICDILEVQTINRELPDRIRTNLARFRSRQISEIGEDVIKGLSSLSINYDSDQALKLAYMISIIYYHTPDYFENHRHFNYFPGVTDPKISKFLKRRTRASEKMQNQMMTHNEPDIVQIGNDIDRHNARLVSVSISNDCLFPAHIQQAHTRAIAARCPGKVKHSIMPGKKDGHSRFLADDFSL